MIYYQGVFFGEETRRMMQRMAYFLQKRKSIHKIIDDLHVTYRFKPTEQECFEADEIGEEVDLRIVGFGEDDHNVAFEVELDDPRYKGANIPHITMFLRQENSKARHSAKLTYQRIQPISIKGKIGVSTGKQVWAGYMETTA